MPLFEQSVYRRICGELDTLISLHHLTTRVDERDSAYIAAGRRISELLTELEKSGLAYPEKLQYKVQRYVVFMGGDIDELRGVRDAFLALEYPSAKAKPKRK